MSADSDFELYYKVMNNKALLTVLSACGLLFGLASCSNEPESKTTMSSRVSNYFVPDDLNGEISVQHNCTYAMMFDNIKGEMTMSATSVEVPGTNGISFTTSPMRFTPYTFENNQSIDFYNGEASEVEDINGYLTNMVFYLSPAYDPFTNITPNPMLVMSYKTDGYEVRTFSPNAYFSGETKTSYDMGAGEQTYTTKDAMYRVNFAQDMTTANVVIYNAKFVESMKAINVILRDLPVTLTRDGYRISVSDVVPELMDGSVATPYPSRTFTSLEIKSSSDLTKIDCDYVVADVFKGQFSGFSCDRFVPIYN